MLWILSLLSYRASDKWREMKAMSKGSIMLAISLIILIVFIPMVQTTCGDYTQEQCADSSSMHQFKRCAHKVFNQCQKRHALKGDPNRTSVLCKDIVYKWENHKKYSILLR